MQILTVVIANVDVFSSSFDDSRGDKGESTLRQEKHILSRVIYWRLYGLP